MSSPSSQVAVRLDAEEAYALWASSYDETPNPLLALEERCLAPMLGIFANRDVVELGCGTGRWLRRFETAGVRSLVGVDISTAMLAKAEKKCLPSTTLLRSDCLTTPLPDRSADCILASFLLSYVPNRREFVAEAARILRPGGTILVSDLHPATPSYGWRRTFKSAGSVFEIATFPYTFSDLTDAMRVAGFRLESMNECCFGENEERIFRCAGKLDQLRQVESLPVIYWARFSWAES
jgi:ubiquinone/menaquinone biosynthesis C-methylase UbiE